MGPFFVQFNTVLDLKMALMVMGGGGDTVLDQYILKNTWRAGSVYSHSLWV